ncbi:MAG TPA: hypothetical protein VEU33_28005 [Archangium sp.]|nr:hypothetical protein [Archangium sp.]
MNAPVRPSLPQGLYVLRDDTVRPELPLVGVGPVFGTTTRQVPAPVLGLEGFVAVVRASPLPIAGLAATGAHGGAVASEALLAQDIAERVRRSSTAFDRGAQGASLVGGDV